MTYLAAFLVPAVLALLISPFAIRLAERAGMMDHPGERRIHREPTARAGGMILFPVLVLALAAGWWGRDYFYYLATALGFIFAVGLWDDWKGAHYSTKFFAQTTAALVVVAAGVKVQLFHWNLVNVLVTVVWIVGITNALNLIDGLDGLAGGLSMNALLSIGVLGVVSGDPRFALFCFILAGGVFGFLRSNLYPARAFLGDSGSMLLGFSIAVTSIIRAKTATFLILAVPVLFIAIPMADTLLAFTRRVSRGDHPFKPDREHLHHRLLDLHFTPQQVLAYFYGFSAVLGLASFAFAQTRNIYILAFSLVLLAAMVLLVRGMRLVNFHAAVAGFNDRLSQVRKRMSSPAVLEKRVLLVRLFFLASVAFNLGTAFLLRMGPLSSLVISTLLITAISLPDLANLDKRAREHAFPWVAVGNAALLFAGQMALAPIEPGKGKAVDNLAAALLLLVILALAAAYLLSRNRLQVFLIHPVVVPVFYALGLAGGVAKHLGWLPGFLPLAAVLANTFLLFAANVFFSRRVLFSGPLLNALAFLGILGLTSALWFV